MRYMYMYYIKFQIINCVQGGICIYILYIIYVYGIIQKGNIFDMIKYDKFENLFIYVFFYFRGINFMIIFNYINNQF